MSSNPKIESLQKDLNVAAQAYQKLQSDLSKQVEIQQRLDSQLNETTNVEKEFTKLQEGDEVFKLIGPVLVKQEVQEAKINVEKRVEFIRSEITRVEKQIKETNDQSEHKKMEVITIQQKIQDIVEGEEEEEGQGTGVNSASNGVKVGA